MKRAFTAVASLALVASYAMPAQGQEETVKFGLQGGVTVSTVSGDDVASADSRTGFVAGGYFSYMFSSNFALAAEANWMSGLGAKNVLGTDAGESDPLFDVKASYLAFPVTLSFVFPLSDDEGVWLGLQSGITPMLNLTCDYNIAGSSQTVKCEDTGETVTSVLWSVPFGAAIGYRMTDATVVWLGARYQLGLTDAIEDSAAKINTWEFLLGVGFPTG
jgi:opacity protein-like surface antigen